MLYPTTVKQLLSGAEDALRRLAVASGAQAEAIQTECRGLLGPLLDVEGAVSMLASRALTACERPPECADCAQELFDLNCLIQP